MKKLRSPLLPALAALALSACQAEQHDSEEASHASAEAPASAASWRAFEPPSDSVLRARLSELAYRVTQEDDTERRHSSELNDNARDGLYIDVVSGEPLFSSRDKFDSGTGWPSFTQPVSDESLTTHTDYQLVLPRSEVRSAIADSHLGHVFPDGPAPTGLRYCINGAALLFVAAEDLEARGYAEFAPLFD